MLRIEEYKKGKWSERKRRGECVNEDAEFHGADTWEWLAHLRRVAAFTTKNFPYFGSKKLRRVNKNDSARGELGNECVGGVGEPPFLLL